MLLPLCAIAMPLVTVTALHAHLAHVVPTPPPLLHGAMLPLHGSYGTFLQRLLPLLPYLLPLLYHICGNVVVSLFGFRWIVLVVCFLDVGVTCRIHCCTGNNAPYLPDSYATTVPFDAFLHVEREQIA